MSSGPMRYRVLVQGRLDAEVAADFAVVEDHESSQPPPITSIVGTFADPAALTGLLVRVSDLGMQLVSVESLDAAEVLT